MVTYLIGLIILGFGGYAYGALCQHMIKPDDDKQTPAVAYDDGVDFVPMPKWKNSIMQLLTIAGTGPVLGPIQGILFGPIAFITIPIGCVIGGAFHDFMVGMISTRNEGAQMPKLIKQFLGKHIAAIYNVFVCILLLLVGVVFLYTPSDMFVSQVLGASSQNDAKNPVFWIICGVILVYYILSTVLPIDKIIGKIYPVFSAVVLISTIAIFIGLFVKGMNMEEVWDVGIVDHFKGLHFFPVFFVTVACGIVSGFHSTQTTLISRTIEKESDGKGVFYNMMITEGFIAMTWAAAALCAIQNGWVTKLDAYQHPVNVVGEVSKQMLGSVFGTIAIIGVMLLPLTSGGTSFRSMKLIIADALHINTRIKRNHIILTSAIFVVASGILVFAKINPDGFGILWNYFAWANQIIAVFAFAMITVYMIKNGLPYIMGLIPGTFYMFIVTSFILNAQIGLNLDWVYSCIVGAVIALGFALAIVYHGKKLQQLSAYESDD